MRRGVRRDVVRERGGDAPALEVDPPRVGDTVRHTHLPEGPPEPPGPRDRKSTRLNSSHSQISYAVFCLKKKIKPPRSQHHSPNFVRGTDHLSERTDAW